MKRCMSFVCTMVILLSMCACSSNSTSAVKPVNFYYKTDPANYQAASITPEIRDSEGYENDLKGLIQLYVDGPISNAYQNPFPKRLAVKSITVNNTTVELQFNERLTQLTDLDMTTACACLTMTVLELTQRYRLIITAVDSAGNIIYTGSMTQDHILLSDYD